MENEGRIVELLSDSLRRFDQMLGEQRETNKRLNHLEVQSEKQEGKLESIDKNLVTLNLHTGENSRAIFKLADNVQQIADLHNRVAKLEKTVYK
jgi:hypothetical protein